MNQIQIYAFADEASAYVDQQIEAMKRNGLNGLEIRGVDRANVCDITVEKAKEVRKKMDDAGLVTWSVGSKIGKVKIHDDFAAHLELYKHTLEIANVLGAGNVRLFSFFMPKDEDPALYKNEVIDRMGRFAELGKAAGVRACHENEKGIYGDLAPRCLDIYQAVPELSGIFDPANYVQCGQDTLEAWKLLGDYIFYMHIKDARKDGTVVPAGKGEGNVARIVKMFREKGGHSFTMEPHLKVFEGLGSLEQEGDTSQIEEYTYPSNDAAFDAACAAFRSIAGI